MPYIAYYGTKDDFSKICTGKTLSEVIFEATEYLKRNKEEVNYLRLFTVPEGFTYLDYGSHTHFVRIRGTKNDAKEM